MTEDCTIVTTVRYEVLIKLSMEITVFLDVTPCSLVDTYLFLRNFLYLSDQQMTIRFRVLTAVLILVCVAV
jgi:hypothetical protein